MRCGAACVLGLSGPWNPGVKFHEGRPAASKHSHVDASNTRPLPCRERLEEQVRQVMKADSEMCVRKLMDELKTKKQSKEMQTLFSEIVKKLCVVGGPSRHVT